MIFKFSKFGGFFAASMMLLGVAATSCSKDDPREPILPPVLEAAPNTLSGVITDIAGNPVEGAKVTLGETTVSTNREGAYTFPKVAQGNYTVKAEANGMYTASASLNFTQADRQNLVWSVSLNKKVTQTLTVKNAAEDATGDVQSENIPDNEEGAVTITVDVPANTVPANTTISISPIYSTEDATGTRAADEQMLIGANVTCSDPDVTLSNPIDVVFNLDASVATEVTVKQYDAASDNWTEVTPEVGADGKVVVKTTKFTSFGIFLPVTVTTTAKSEELTFARNLFDNRNGNGTMHVDAASFTYKTGTEVKANAKNKLEGLLIEFLARQFGAKVTEVTGSYPLNVDLAVGQGVQLKGTQAVDEVKVSSKNTTVTGTRYGAVTVTAQAFSVDHNGGIVGGDL